MTGTQNPLSKLSNLKTQTPHTNWSDKANENISNLGKAAPTPIKKVYVKSNKVVRKTFGCRIYMGKIDKTFDNDFNKLKIEMIKSGKLENPEDFKTGDYLMFILSFANKYNLKDLYVDVDTEGHFDLDKKKLEEHFKKYSKQQ